MRVRTTVLFLSLGIIGCARPTTSAPAPRSSAIITRCASGCNDDGSSAGLLTFAVFGDSRPPSLDDTNDYPADILGGIFALAQSNGAQFVVGTGDYMFASTPAAVDAQVQLFLRAQANYTAGPVYLAMGNHECNGYTNSNCPEGNETPNVQAFMNQLLPTGTNTPYYRIDIQTPLGNAKFLFVAANAWSAAQQSWLEAQLAQPTTYTFVVRHEPSSARSAPGVTPSEQLLEQVPYTLELLGHSHEYRRVDTTHVITGNAGAPLSGSASGYGLLLISQQPNGNITASEIDETSGNPIDSWTVTPDGQPAS